MSCQSLNQYITIQDADNNEFDLLVFEGVNLIVDSGVAGPPGVAGTNGYAPILAVVTDGARKVLQVTSWTGGTGTPPTSGLYIGPTGLVSNIADAVDITTALTLEVLMDVLDLIPEFDKVDVAEQQNARYYFASPEHVSAAQGTFFRTVSIPQ